MPQSKKIKLFNNDKLSSENKKRFDEIKSLAENVENNRTLRGQNIPITGIFW